MSDRCRSCGVLWEDHLGIQGICQQLQEKRTMDAYLVQKIAEALAEADDTEELEALVGLSRNCYRSRFTARDWYEHLTESLSREDVTQTPTCCQNQS